VTSPDIVHLLLARLEFLARERDTFRKPDPLPASPWIAMSVLQKAIRRGRVDLAHRAAATLLMSAPARLWRRLGVIAFEDIGAADLDAVYMTTAALTGQSSRLRMGGEWPAACFLVDLLARAPKCRAADDLAWVARQHPAYEAQREQITSTRFEAALEVAAGTSPLVDRTIAMISLLDGSERDGRQIAASNRHPAIVFEALRERGVPHTAVDIAEIGFRRTGEVVCALLPLLAITKAPEDHTLTTDALPPEAQIAGIPGWALDTFTREGRRALASFAKTRCSTTEWLRAEVPASRRTEVLANLVFFAESGLLDQRCTWPTAVGLRDKAETGCFGVPNEKARVALDLIHADIPLLNKERARVL
jgi:hypothetical protein